MEQLEADEEKCNYATTTKEVNRSRIYGRKLPKEQHSVMIKAKMKRDKKKDEITTNMTAEGKKRKT